MTKDSAQEAIENENKTQLLDKVIAVRTAVKRNESDPPSAQIPSFQQSPAAPDIGPVKVPPQQSASSRQPFIRNYDSNDIEIIVVSRVLTSYAELIEDLLRKLGLKVDLLFPNIQVSMAKILENIKSRGTLYAIIVNPENMQHQSVTLYTLHTGMNDVCRKNMPLKLALEFIETDFKTYLESIKAKQATLPLDFEHPSVPSVVTPALYSNFDEVQTTLELLLAKQPVTVVELDALTSFITKMRANLNGDPPEPELSPEELALQKKIMRLLVQKII